MREVIVRYIPISKEKMTKERKGGLVGILLSTKGNGWNSITALGGES
jgi:hypothetical protein